MQIKFTKEDIKYSTDIGIYERAKEIYNSGKVVNLENASKWFYATVKSTKDYNVSISTTNIERSSCDCYMGKNNQLCKHILALSLAVLDKYGETQKVFNSTELTEIKKNVSLGLRKIKGYAGPSKKWFSYQKNLNIGINTIVDSIKHLECTENNAKYIWSIVKKLSLKLSDGGVDDSDGVVGNGVYKLIEQLIDYYKNNKELKKIYLDFASFDSGFGFEEHLIEFIENDD